MELKATYIQQFDPKRGLVFVPNLLIDGIKTAILNADHFNSKETAIAEAEAVIKQFLDKDERKYSKKSVKTKSDYDKPNPKAAASLRVKMEAIRDTIDSMTKEEYGDWVNSLEFDEFMELIKLG